MSYILESLKKSDQERHSSRSEKSVVKIEAKSKAASYDNYLNDTNIKKPIKSKKWVFLAFLLSIAFVFFAYVYWPTIKVTDTNTPPLEIGDAILQNNTVSSSVGSSSALPSLTMAETVQPTVKNSTLSVMDDHSLIKKELDPDLGKNSEAAIKETSTVNTFPAVDILYQDIRQEESESISALYETEAVEEIGVVANSNAAVSTTPKESEKNVLAIPSVFTLDRQLQQSIPAISYGAHIYASDNKSGFVILDGAKRRVGEKMSSGIYVEKIHGDFVVLSFRGIIFSLPAMKNWNP
ncbi:hypothetical protein IMCC1989_768 [gamma proteobacterium IMCC1989]|nr:hypothetical protein IMCC1989_768 [gamma proteobacterium IMCC1989]